ncbi:MAG TPA: DUF3667 domain-containing protein [Saprospiraceae bacterium]|nr:DUF3667 domain-containing protein [Saprospiraceae bacterium]
MARKIRQQVCGNCGHRFELDEHFCPKCGQENHSPNQPIRHYLSELVETLLHLDSKFFSTVATMVRHPGKTTLEYNENKRARYMPPVRLYIFVSLVFFLLVRVPSLYKETGDAGKDPIRTESRSTGPQAGADAPTPDTTTQEKVKGPKDTVISFNYSNIRWSFTKEEIDRFRNAKPEQIDSLIISRGNSPTYINRKLAKQLLKSWNADEAYGDQIREQIIKFFTGALFILMPLFAWFLSIVYRRRRKFYYEYLIFAIHYHTVSFMILSVALLVDRFVPVPSAVFLFVVLGLIFYLYKALRYNYGQGRGKTFLKTGILCFLYGLTLIFAAIIIIFLGWLFV